MKPDRALRYAIECMQAECQRLAVDANYFDLYQTLYRVAKRQGTTPQSLHASARRRLIRIAMATLRKAILLEPEGAKHETRT